jgi:gliding motility-associated protein GldM
MTITLLAFTSVPASAQSQIDAGDFHINKIEAIVIPNSTYIIKGGKYRANIILAATDSTKLLDIEVNGRPLEGQVYEVPVRAIGRYEFKGNISTRNLEGITMLYPFKSEFSVGELLPLISPDMMNIFYAGIDNPLSVYVPGVDPRDVEISVTNATQVKTPIGWNIRPNKTGAESVITVTALFDGEMIPMGHKVFRVKPLPMPVAKLEHMNEYGKEKFRGGSIAKNLLVTATRVIADSDDDDLDIRFKVLSFSLNYTDSEGNTLVEQAEGAELTERQLNILKKMTNGKTVYITNVEVIGPDNIKRRLQTIDIALK